SISLPTPYSTRLCHHSTASPPFSLSFFFNDPPTTQIYTLSLHDALPISIQAIDPHWRPSLRPQALFVAPRKPPPPGQHFRKEPTDRKSTRLNSSHRTISYAVFCLKKKKKTTRQAANKQEQTHTRARHRHK